MVCLFLIIVILLRLTSRNVRTLTMAKQDADTYREQIRKLRPTQNVELARRLHADSEQRQKLDQIISDCDELIIHFIEVNDREKVMSLGNCAENKIWPILKKDQRPLFDQFMKEKRAQAARFYENKRRAREGLPPLPGSNSDWTR